MYESTILSLGVLASLMLVQFLIADVVGIRSKHIPGTAVPSDHNLILFRATRMVANTNETIGIFIIAVLFCIYSNANPAHLAYACWTFVAARTVYIVCYLGDLRILRSCVFVVCLLSLIAILVIGFRAPGVIAHTF